MQHNSAKYITPRTDVFVLQGERYLMLLAPSNEMPDPAPARF